MIVDVIKLFREMVHQRVLFIFIITVIVIDAQYLNVSEIRLVGGSGSHEGRVEFNMNGIWGTVCDYRFDIYDARVMCRMMNLKAFTFVGGAQYGQGNGPIYAQSFDCGGYESNIQSCPFVANALCTHSMDVGIVCSECGEISTENGVSTLSSNGTVLSTKCNEGYTINNTQIVCNGSRWGVSSLVCVLQQNTNIDGIRLANGVGIADGRVEVSINGSWGTVCSVSFGWEDVAVMCKMLGLQRDIYWYNYWYLSWYNYGPSYAGVGNGSIFISELGCKGTENNISECYFKTNHTCSHNQDVVIACYLSTNLPISGVRLTNGTGPYDGRVELLSSGQWGTICDKSRPNLNNGISFANTICKMINLSLTHVFENTVYGEGGFPILIWNLQCPYNALNITSCSYNTVYGSNGVCSHRNDLSLICTPCGFPPNVNESTVSFNGSDLAASCYLGFVPEQIKMQCLSSGRWDVTCTSVYEFPLNISSIRLQGYSWPPEGHVRILVNGSFGGICKNKFDANDAAVLCRMMKLKYVSFFVNNISNINYQYGVDKVPTYVDNLECTGNESHINECTYDVNNNCTYWDQVAIKCTEYQLNITDIRLSGSTIPYSGRIEVKVNNTWGTICQTSFDYTKAALVCRMLGFGDYYTHYYYAYYGAGTGPIYIDVLYCDSSSYPLINYCTYTAENFYHGCTHSYDVSVKCFAPKLNITEVRLVNGTGPYNGRAELKVNGVWGTICDQNFDMYAADLFCQELHLRAITYKTGAANGAGRGPVYIEQLFCSRYYHYRLADCPYLFYNSCRHDRDVSVVCSAPMLNITEVRLVNGIGPYNGRAELKVNGIWGTICDERFDILAADLFCQEFHLRASKYFTGATHGAGSGPIYIEQLFCSSNNVKLADCNYLSYNSCSHDRDVSIVCSACGVPDLSTWDVDYFIYNGSELYADCYYYKTYVGILRMKCNNVTGRWFIEGQCKEYSYPLTVDEIILRGGNASSGRVELKTLDTWGTVCDHSFGMKEAETICRMIGFSPAKNFLVGAYFGKGAGPIFVNDLKCGDSAAHINNCTYNVLGSCQHSNDVSVICTDCGSPKLANATLNSTKTNVGAAVKVTCDDGYRINGNDVVICQTNEKWTTLPTCTYINCGDPTPENGIRNSTSTSNGTVVKISCKLGYDLIGDSVVSCQQNDTWSSRPTCRIKDCGTPNPPFSKVVLTTNKTTYGAYAIISCSAGYRPEGNKTVSCQPNGTWETSNKCEIVDCGNPTPIRGLINNTVTTYGSIVGVSCEPGLNLSGAAVIVCKADGTWNGSPICDPSDCGRLQLSHGNITALNGTSRGASVTARCDRGYDLHGSPVLTCTSKGWNDTVACIKQDCGSPRIANGTITSIAGTLYGDTAIMQCNIGYDIIGDAVITCTDGGRWSNNSRCSIKDCGSVTVPTNGFMDDTKGTKYNSNIKFYCNDGFLLVGNRTIDCKSDGKWSADPPRCFAKSEIGGSCQGDEYCLSRGALCRKSVCSCFTGIHDNRTHTCDAMPLFPYGVNENDVKIPASSECGPKLTFSPGVPLFKKKHTDIFVCKNGMVTFDNIYSNPTPPKNKESVSSTLNGRTVVAPFHGAIDTRKSGPVYYRAYDILNSWSRMKEEAGLIMYIEGIVNKFANVTEFETSFMLIATWTDTRCARDDFDDARTSTFQVVIVSDGRKTYVFYIYGQGQMQWREKVSSIQQCRQVFVGYTVDSGEIYTHPWAFSSQSLELDDIFSNTAKRSELDVAGLIFQPMIAAETEHENDAVDCIKWYNDNKEDRQRLDYLASMMPECPCDIMLSRYDPWFWRIGLERWRTDVSYSCVDMLPTGNFAQYGKSCCYELRTKTWVYERPLTGNFKLYKPQTYPAESFRNDALPKEKCCVLSNYCHLYYKLRPTGGCYQQSPYKFGSFWGDPHFRTLDGMNFTFNGLGEFTMLQIRTENYTFDLQARTARALKQDGNLSDATAFSAFAAKDSSNASVHVELNKGKTGLNVFANTVDLTTAYNAKNTDGVFEYSSLDNNLYLAKRNGALGVLFPITGISLNISMKVGMLILSTLVPQAFRNQNGQVLGLLGNYDDDPYNDFTMPDGTILPANINERQIFDYGMTWSIDENNSAFVYQDGKNHSSYHNASYVPKFLDEADPVKKAEAEKVCNGSQNIECVFDYVFTENQEVAEATNLLKGQTVETIRQLAITVPSLVGCNTMTAIVGQNVSCVVEYSDEDTIEFINNNVNAVFERNTSTVTYLQKTNDPVDIKIISKNGDGRLSPIFTLNVILCTGCSGHGNCTEDIREDNRSTQHFKYSACLCEQAYEGIDCENVFDGCAASPCSHGRKCTKLSSAAEQMALNRTYNCSACPSGYTDDDRYCKDLDECNELAKPCEQNCLNTDGSYMCSCSAGFRVNTDDVGKCRDINECEEALHNCSQLCNNTVGGFECVCYSGYTFNTSSWMCIKNEVPVCNDTMIQKCINTSGCTIDKTGATVCFCNEGFELDEFGTACTDVNECQRNVCPQNCSNSNGSFECVCYPGYKLVDKTTCQACEVPYWGESCLNQCPCTGRGAERCDPLRGCICKFGWQGDTCNEDINECEVIIDACTDPRKQCSNVQGSYRCKCLEGYTELDNGTCSDVDECSNPALNYCSQTCLNTVGGYSCGCQVGFTKVNKTSCKDIDECTLGTHKCQQMCVNNQGTYTCLCHLGYTLNDDRRTCEKQLDRVSSDGTLACSHYGLLEGSNVACRCYEGYTLGSDSQSCSDVNECEDATENQCSESAKCVNTVGSYLCKCPYGSKLENDGRTCSECDENHFGDNCSQTCGCIHGYCNKTAGCICTNGWAGNHCDKDLNECDIGIISCSTPNSVCVNTLGSAICSCKSGYFNKAGNCEDIDECNDSSTNVCDHICVNTEGSYRCECHSGFLESSTGICTDVNECWGIHGCDQNCENTVGSYRCSCQDGYKLNITDRRSCFAETACTPEQTIACEQHATCSQTSSGPVCTCVKGFVNKTLSCQDMDECKNTVSPCAQNCTNTVGSFTCSCASGFFLRQDKTSCQECDNWTYGARCGYNCSCSRTNTYSCDKVLGKCNCVIGWEGVTCNQDIDECQNASICPENSKCNNRLGSYLCVCNDGYFKSGDGQCEECDDRHFGQNCFSSCICNLQNTQDCNHINGACVCKTGWTGVDCSEGTGDTSSLVVDVSVKIEHDLPEGTNLSSSTTYKEVKSKVRASLVDFYKRYTKAAVDIIIKDIRLGSIYVYFNMVSEDQSDSVVSALARALWALGKGSYIIFDGQNVIATAENYNFASPCDVYESIRKCADNFHCVDEGDTPICRLDEKKGNWRAIVGGTVGGVTFIVVAALTAFLCVRFNGGKNKIQQNSVKPRDDYGSDEKMEYNTNFQGNRGWQEGSSNSGSDSGYPFWSTIMPKMTIPSDHINKSSPPYLMPLDGSSLNFDTMKEDDDSRDTQDPIMREISDNSSIKND